MTSQTTEKRKAQVVTPFVYTTDTPTITLTGDEVTVQVPETFVSEAVDTHYDGDNRIDYIIEQLGYDFQNALEYDLDLVQTDDDGFALEPYNEFVSEGFQPGWKLTVDTCWLTEPDTHVYGAAMAELFRASIVAEVKKRAEARRD